MRSARALASLRGRVVTSHDPPAPSPALLWTSSCQTNSVPSRRRPTGVCTPTSTSSASISDSRPGSIRGIFTVHAPEGNHRTSHRRKIHSSSSALAQPLETPITSPGGEEWEWHPDYATAPDSFLSPRIPFQPPPAPIHPNSTPASTSTAASLASAKPAPAPVSASQAEYIPSESDFDPHVDAYDDSYTFTHGPSPSPLPPAPELPSYADPAPSRPRRRTRNVLPDLPPLPAGQLPPDGQTRHDWRARATSRASKGKGKRWFPDLARRRESAAMTQLQPGEVYHEEVERYWAHFEPLLQMEYEEEQRLHRQRQLEWTEERLKREGYMLDAMATSEPFRPKRKDSGFVYTVTKKGREATSALPFNRFTVGTFVELSRTHPHLDCVEQDGTTRARESQNSAAPMLGTVYAQTKGSIQVEFPCEVADATMGLWRLDVGCSDFALKRQLRAMQALHLDPAAQDMAGFAGSSARRLELLHPVPLSDADEALDDALRTRRPNRKSEFILHGTNLRDKLLRAFQEDFIPYDAAAHSVDGTTVAPVEDPGRPRTGASLEGAHDVVQETKSLKPDDIDATPIPSTSRIDEPQGLLGRDQVIQSWTKRYRASNGKEPVAVEGDPDVPLNPSQMRAIAMMLSERLSLVQGPPGTGKTRVIIETIKLLKIHWQLNFPILVAAHTNAAVDNLLAGLRGHGVKATRLGAADRVREDLQTFTFETAMEEHPLFAEVEELQSRVKELYAKAKATEVHAERDELKSDARRRSGRMYGLKQTMIREVLLDADVICTTCLSAASRYLDGIDFPIVFLDEASMATEPLSLIPLVKGSSHVAIIGDHKQLPPVIISADAHAGGLSTSLFERLIHERQIPSIMLDTQYRMHPSISSFPNQAFYAGALRDGTASPSGDALERFDPPQTAFLVTDERDLRRNVTFVDHDYPESPQSQSIANYGDAERVCDVVADLLDKNPSLRGSDIGVITPYAAQIRLLDHYLHQEPTRQTAFLDLLGDERARELEDIEIRTVDGFEGREKEVIIFSTVRSNERGYVGFLADWRRLNVGLTRAKRALIMIGSASTLEKAKIGRVASDALPSGGGKVWKDFMGHLRKEGLVLRAE